MSTQKLLRKNAEVTLSGIKKRGASSSKEQKLVTYNSTPLGKLKKRLITGTIVAQTAVLYVGIVTEYTGEALLHGLYLLSFVALTGLLTTFFTKME